VSKNALILRIMVPPLLGDNNLEDLGLVLSILDVSQQGGVWALYHTLGFLSHIFSGLAHRRTRVGSLVFSMFVGFVLRLVLPRTRLPGCSGKEFDAVPSVLLGRIHADISFVKKIRHRVITALGSYGDSHADSGGGCA